MSHHFDKVCGGAYSQIFCSGDINPRFVVAYHGEDTERVLAAFNSEHPKCGGTPIVVFAHGIKPRKGLCTKESLLAAFGNVSCTDPLYPSIADWLADAGYSVDGRSLNALAPSKKAEVIQLPKRKRKEPL